MIAKLHPFVTRFLAPYSLSVLLVGGLLRDAETAEPAVVDKVSWTEVEQTRGLASGTLVQDDEGQAWLRIAHATDESVVLPLVEISDPPVRGRSYGVRGRVRYQDVVGDGFLEMWNYFPEGGQAFSRTLGDYGPMQKIKGTSPAREFVLPFDTTGSDLRPDRLAINLVLAGSGTVEISDLEVLDYGDISIASQGVTATGDWWSDRMGGVIGGIAGSLLGLFGALVGTCMGVGRARWLVKATAAIMALGGLPTTIAGVVAVTQGQPYAVYYPLLLIGGMSLLAGVILFPLVDPAYRRHEMRRMQMMDAMG